MLRWVFLPHKHLKGLVPAFLLALSKITHASLYPPVRIPSKSNRLKGVGIKYTPDQGVAHNTLLSHTPTGNSSDKN